MLLLAPELICDRRLLPPAIAACCPPPLPALTIAAAAPSSSSVRCPIPAAGFPAPALSPARGRPEPLLDPVPWPPPDPFLNTGGDVPSPICLLSLPPATRNGATQDRHEVET